MLNDGEEVICVSLKELCASSSYGGFQGNILPLCVGHANIPSDLPGSSLPFHRGFLVDNLVLPFDKYQEQGDLHGHLAERCSQTKEGSSSRSDLGRELEVSGDKKEKHSSQGNDFLGIADVPCYQLLEITVRNSISCLEQDSLDSLSICVVSLH